MTVLTFPSTGSKSDKVPLVDHEAAVAMDRSPVSSDKQSAEFDPKRLEAGDLEPLQQKDSEKKRELRLRARWTVRGKLYFSLAIALAATFIVFATLHMACRKAAVDKKCHHLGHHYVSPEYEQRVEAAVPLEREEDERKAYEFALAPMDAVGSKSFSSYEAAEKDMAEVRASIVVEHTEHVEPQPQPGDDYDAAAAAALQFNTMIASTGGEENANWRRIEDFAIVNKAVLYSRTDRENMPIYYSVWPYRNIKNPCPDSEKVKVVNWDAPSTPISISKSSRFIHDFSVNITGIVDTERQRCFVMSLIRNNMTPPSTLDDLLDKMTTGYYSSDLSEVLHHMRAIKPALKNLTQADYGLYISRDCALYPTFRLEKIDVSTTVQPPVADSTVPATAT